MAAGRPRDLAGDRQPVARTVGQWLADGTPTSTSRRLAGVVVAARRPRAGGGRAGRRSSRHVRLSRPIDPARRAAPSGSAPARPAIQPLRSGIAEIDRSPRCCPAARSTLTKSLAVRARLRRRRLAPAPHAADRPAHAARGDRRHRRPRGRPGGGQHRDRPGRAAHPGRRRPACRAPDGAATSPRRPCRLDSVIAALQREWQPAFEQARRSVRVHGERGLVVQADPGRPVPGALDAARELPGPRPRHRRRRTPAAPARRSSSRSADQGDGVPAAIAPHIFERSVTHERAPASGSPWRVTSPSPTAAGSSSSRPSRRSSPCSSASPTPPEAALCRNLAASGG